jgi:hypothetical protein
MGILVKHGIDFLELLSQRSDPKAGASGIKAPDHRELLIDGARKSCRRS